MWERDLDRGRLGFYRRDFGFIFWGRDLIVEKRIGPRIRCYWKVN